MKTKTSRQTGQGIVEYALITLVIAVGVWGILQLMGVSVSDVLLASVPGISTPIFAWIPSRLIR